MSWKDELYDLEDNIWTLFHVRKYLNGKYGEGTWTKNLRASIDRYIWEKDNLKVDVQKPTIKEGMIRIYKEGEEPIIEKVYDLKKIKEWL
jgi:hypothetical protein